MSDAVIQVENLSKRYIIAHQRDASDGLRHRLENALRAPWRWIKGDRRPASSAREEFWALKDISFSIKRGEVIGVIGRNGAGKSTLLKILSRITEPTQGRIRIRGRVASLLEVGTGFHPELTGRENVFLNGAILGMPKAEIVRKFDAIVAFAEIEKFLDTPVKRYSSGMYVRLAFAVAAHLDPEILVVDEVLAVGDAEFQKKCLSKMGDVAQGGRTVVFVSHNMQAVTRLCSRSILLHRGEIKMDGNSNQVANAYLNSGVTTTAAREWPDRAGAPGDEVTRLRAVRVRSAAGAVVDSIDIREPVGIELEYDVLAPGHHFLPHFGVRNEDGTMLFVAVDLDPEWRGRKRPPGRYISTGWVPGNFFAEGLLSIVAVIMTLGPDMARAMVEDAVAFRVRDELTNKDTARGDYARPMPGLMRPFLRWTTRCISPNGAGASDQEAGRASA
jgi:lipopolysaccharide transport system ATP-binding protein